jgi:hypothetical protein
MRFALLSSVGLLLGFALLTPAQEPTTPQAEVITPRATELPQTIATRVDQEIQKKLDGEKLQPSPVADDAEFMRRVYLDITGKIPTPDKARAFLDSKDPEKRAKLIDDLLASSDYGRHFGIIWRTMLYKRDVDANRALNLASFQDWMTKSFNDNRGWNKIVYDLLTAEGATDAVPQAMFYMANRDMTRVDPAKITGSVSNMFLGVQMQCAECHNHPFVRQWKQTDFWGMAAFFGRTRDDVTPAKGNKAAPTGKIIESAKANAQGKRPGGGFGGGGGGNQPVGTIAIPSPVTPGKVIGSAPAKFFEAESPKLDGGKAFRPVFADWVTSPTNKYFARAMANRMWAHFMARGIINPVEDMHEDNEATHPELLKLLADEFVANGFDLKHLIRCIANSHAYQRTSAPIAENKDDEKLYSHQTIRVMSAEVLYDSLTIAIGSEPGGGGGFGGRGFGGGGPGGGGAGGRAGFVRFFDTKEDSDPTDAGHGIPQYLRLMNSAPFNRGGRIVNELVRDKLTPDQAIEKLYLTVLSRRPTETEVARLTSYLNGQSDAKKGYDGVLWILVNSAEFICIR